MKEIKIGDWYYRMMGYGGSDSQYCCIMRECGETTPSGVYSLFGPGGMRRLPVTALYEAVDEKGRSFKVSANDLAANGHIGIGTLEEPHAPHAACLRLADAERLVEAGRFTKEEIEAEFPLAFDDGDDGEGAAGRISPAPMTAGQERILRAAREEAEKAERRKVEEANRKYAAEVARLREKYSYIPCPVKDGQWPSVGDKRRNVLAVLKHEFPGVKFRAHTRNGSTSDSIRVEYSDGPAYNKVMKVLNGFETSRFNAYEDIHEDCTQPAACVCGGFDYVFLNRETSEDVWKYVHDYVLANVGGATEENARGAATKVCRSTDFPVGGYEIEGLELVNCEWTLHLKAKAAA